MAEENINLAYKISESFYGCLLEKEEVKGFALLGLVKAATTFDESKGYKFSTYAVPVTRNEILMELRKVGKFQGKISLDAEFKSSEEQYEGASTLLEILPCREKGFEVVENSDLIPSLLAHVNSREREAIILTVLSENTQKEAAQKMNVTQTCVSRNVRSGVRKMREKYYM